MFTYATKKNRYGDEHTAVSAHGAEIATIKASSYYGNTEYIVSATIGGDDRGDYLGRASTIAGAKKKIRDWYSDHSAAVTTAAANSRAADLRRLPPRGAVLGLFPQPGRRRHHHAHPQAHRQQHRRTGGTGMKNKFCPYKKTCRDNCYGETPCALAQAFDGLARKIARKTARKIARKTVCIDSLLAENAALKARLEQEEHNV